MKKHMDKLLFLLLIAGLILSCWALDGEGLSPFFYPLGLVLVGLAGCIWNWRREQDFTYGFLACTVGVIAGILIAVLLCIAIP